MNGVLEAFYAAVQAMATVISTPFPKGINRATVGDWDLTLNTADEPMQADGIDDPVKPFEVYATNNKYLAFAILGPSGGAVGGMTEDEFIADLAARQEPSA